MTNVMVVDFVLGTINMENIVAIYVDARIILCLLNIRENILMEDGFREGAIHNGRCEKNDKKTADISRSKS